MSVHSTLDYPKIMVALLPECVGHPNHLLLVLGVLDVRVGEVDDGALHRVALVAVDEHVRPPHHLQTPPSYI